MRIRISFVLIFLFSMIGLWGQQGWEAGGWVGVSHYFGDLNTNLRLGDPGYAGGLIARYNFNKRVCLKMSGNYGNISAQDADSDNLFEKARNLSFRSVVLDGTAQMEFNFLTYTHGSRDELFTPYLLAGITVLHFNPQAEYNGEWIDLRPLGTEGQFRGEEYYTTQMGLAYGIGLKMDLSYRWSLNLELSARRLFTDYLDDVSTVYADKDDLEKLRGDVAVALSDRALLLTGVNEDGALSQPGRQRGNSVTKDAYAFFGISLLYYFGDLKCPEYSR
ncbi:MAG: outer membrane beta-barrel protein [Saprospirales bacterium]|nr:outer membrane beta-barrel protein [Saprospirales bacterium]